MKESDLFQGEQIIIKADHTWTVKDQVNNGIVNQEGETKFILQHDDVKHHLRIINFNTVEVTRGSNKWTLGRCFKKNSYIDVYQKYTQGIQLKLIRKDDKETGAEIVNSVTLGLEEKKVVTNAMVKFSPGPKSKYLALYLKELKSLRILQIKDSKGKNEADHGIELTFQSFAEAQAKVRKELKELMNKPKKENFEKDNRKQKEEMAELRRNLKQNKKKMKQQYKETFYLAKSYEKKQVDDNQEQEDDQKWYEHYGLKRNQTFNKMDFFNQDKFIILSSKHMIEIIDLESRSEDKTNAKSLILTLKHLNQINQFKLRGQEDHHMLEYDFDLICDVRLKKILDNQFKLQIACRQQGIKQIEVIEIENWYDFKRQDFKHLVSEVNSDGIQVAKGNRFLQFHGDINDNIVVKISQNFDQVVLVNGKESYLSKNKANEDCIDHDTKEGDYTKAKDQITRMIPQLHGKQIHFIYPDDEGGFFFVAFNPYDQTIDIIHSNMDEFKVEFHRSIEPNIIQVFDMNLQWNHKTQKQILRLASSKDNGFALDTATYERNKGQSRCVSKFSRNNDIEIKYETDEFQAIQAFYARWPYITFAGLDKTMLLIFSAFTSEVIRLKIPNDPLRILFTYITEHYDLYILCQKEDEYYLNIINLDHCNPNEYQNNIFNRVCKNQTILKYFSKDVEDKPFVAMHVRGESSKDTIDNNEKAIVYLLHQDMLYCWKKEHHVNQKLIKVGQTISRSFYTLNDANFFLLEGNDTSMAIIQYAFGFNSVEQTAVHEVLLSNEKIINFNVDTSSKKLLIYSKMKRLPKGNNRKITVYDLAQKKIIFDLIIREMHLCGRLESGLYTLVDGHLYFNNDVIKLRYDLIEQPKSIKYQENEIFDYYENIFIMKEGQKIMANCPINSMSFHKFIYVVKSPISLRPTKIVIMPYLHEKRIYLNRAKKFTDYFYTSIDLKDIKKMKDGSLRKVKQIVCVNLSEYKYYIYSLRGLLRNRVDFQHIIQKYGRLQAVSQNGQNFVLFKTRLDQGSASMSIFHLTNRDFYFIKKIDIIKQMKDYYKRLQSSLTDDKKELLKRQGTGSYMETLIKHNPWIQSYKAQFEFSINNHFDVCIKISKKNLRTFYHGCDTHGLIRYKFEEKIAEKTESQIKKNLQEAEARQKINKDQNGMIVPGSQKQKDNKRRQSKKSNPQQIEESQINDSQLNLLKGIVNVSYEEGQSFVPSTSNENKAKSEFQTSKLKTQFPDPRLDFDTIFYFQAGRYQPGRRMEYELNYEKLQRSKSMSPYKKDKEKKLSSLKRSRSQFEFQRQRKVQDEVVKNQQQHKNVPRDLKKQISSMMEKKVQKPLIEQQFFYFQDDSRKSYLLNTDNYAQKQQEHKQSIRNQFFSSQKKIESFEKCRNFKMNDEYVIFWDSKTIWTIALEAEKVVEEKVGFEVRNKDMSKKIIDVRTGSNPRIIAIIVENAQTEQCIITFDLGKKKQKALFDVAKEEYELLWDSDGIPYIVQEDKTIFTKQKSIMKCHEANDLKNIKQNNQNYKKIALQAGHRVDGKDHNWMILNQYISLPFSFMTFVIKQKIEICDERQKKNIFDPTPYNYLIDRRGPFIDSSFVKDDHEALDYVLKQLHNLDPKYIDQLMYTKTDMVRQEGHEVKKVTTALHVAYQADNNRSVDIILNYMSLSKIKHTKPFSDIMKELVDHRAFSNYFAKCQEQNILMENKLILKVRTAYKPGRIAKLAESTTLFLDDEFYRSQMKDQQSRLRIKNDESLYSYLCMRQSVESYSVDVRALRIDWIFSEAGEQFLNEIYDSDDLDLFANSSIEMMVEFIFKRLIPLRDFFLIFILVQFTALLMTMLFADKRVYVANREELELCQHYEEGEEDGLCPDYDWQYNPSMDSATAICGIVNLFLNTLQLYAYRKEYRGSVSDMVFRWKLVDLVYIILVYILCILHIGHFVQSEPIWVSQMKKVIVASDEPNAVEDTTLMWERFIFTIIVLCMCVRLLYYLKLYTWFSQYIEIFIDIMEVMIPFSFMIVLMIITFAIAFYMLGRNQIQYKNKVNPAKEPDYATFQGALWEIFNVCMGNPGFSVGDYHEDAFFLNHETTLVGACLLIVYVIACFILLLNLLNMLIAIMSDAFTENSEKIEQIKIHARLCFILDKWAFKEHMGMLNIDQGSKKDEKSNKKGKVEGIKYVVCAFIQEQDKNNTNLIKQLQNDLKETNAQIANNQNDMFIGQKEMRSNQREMVRDIKTDFMKQFDKINEKIQKLSSKIE